MRTQEKGSTIGLEQCRLETQFSVTEIMEVAESEESATRGILKAICRGMGWEVGEYWGLEEGEQCLRLKGFWSETPGIGELEELNRQFSFEKGMGTPGYVWQTKKPLWSVDVHYEACFHRKQLADSVGLKGSLAFPVATHREYMGTMVFFTRQTRFEEALLTQIMANIGTQFAHFLVQRKRERELRVSQEKFRIAFEGGPMGLGFISEDLKLLAANEVLCKMLGYTKEELSAKSVAEITHPADLERLRALKDKIFSGESASLALEKRYVSKTGKTIWANFTAKRMSGLKENSIRALAMIEDISVRKEMEKRLQGYLEKLHQSNRDLSEFTRIASHDLREPLNTINNYLSLISRKLDGNSAEIIEYFAFVQGAASRMRNLIETLLQYAKLEETNPQFEQVALSRVIDGLKKDLGDLVGRTGAELMVESLPTVWGDPSRLGQLFHNLVSNAIKYSGSNPKVRIAGQPNGVNWEISVSDSGCGIPKEFLTSIFQPFKRLHTASDVPGTGLGLAICKRIVESHGGQIWAESADNSGSIFKFTLPFKSGR